MLANSVSAPFDVRTVDRTDGALDRFDYIDGFADAAAHLRAHRVPRGAPLAVGGWALDPGGAPPTQVIAVIDDTLAYAAQTGFSRRDVMAQRGPGTPEYTGFRLVLPSDGLVPGGHGVRAYALGSNDTWYRVGQQDLWVFDLARPELGTTAHALRMQIDNTATLSGTGVVHSVDRPLVLGEIALIRGWAIDLVTNRGPAGVYATDTAGHRWHSGCEVPRIDVAHAYALTGDRIGFEITVPTDVLGRGRHPLRVGAFDHDGRPFRQTADVTIDVAAVSRQFPGYARLLGEPAAGAVLLRKPDGKSIVLDELSEFDAERGDVFAIEGWALARDGTAATDLYLELHHAEVTVPPYRYFPQAGLRNEKTPRELNAPPCSDSWFFGRLDTSNLARRAYGLSLAVVTPDRRAFARRALGVMNVL